MTECWIFAFDLCGDVRAIFLVGTLARAFLDTTHVKRPRIFFVLSNTRRDTKRFAIVGLFVRANFDGEHVVSDRSSTPLARQ